MIIEQEDHSDSYHSFEEKAKSFRFLKIDNIEDLESLVNCLSKNDSLRFRGVKESKYKMLTSLQRHNHVGVSDKDYISGLLAKVKQNDAVRSFFSENGIAINNLSCLSLMQHYSLPTPLLDFTINVHVALSFAAKDIEKNGRNELDDYCSLYFFDLKQEYEIDLCCQASLVADFSKGINYCIEYYKAYPSDIINESILREIDKFIKWDVIENQELLLIEYQGVAPVLRTLDNESLNLSNPNLSTQEGLFVLNLYKDNIPLEDNWNMRTKEARDRLLITLKPGESFPFIGPHTTNQMTCVDIKKDVILEWNKINPITLFDNSDKMKEFATTLEIIKNQYDIQSAHN